MVDRENTSGILRLKKKQPFTTKGYYQVMGGAVAMIVKDGDTAGVIGIFFQGDVICIVEDCWIEAVVESYIRNVPPINGLEVKQFAEACIRQLENKSLYVTDIVYNLLIQFTEHQIVGVKIVDIAKILGFTRERIGQAINNLIDEGKVKKIRNSHWETPVDR